MLEENGYNKVVEALADMNEAIGAKFEEIKEKLTEHDVRFDKVDQQLLEIRARLDRIEDIMIKDLRQRMGALEEKVGTGK